MSIGFDAGTFNLVLAQRDEKNEIIYKREVNAFIEIPLTAHDRFVFNMMKNNKENPVPLIEDTKNQVAYALGEAAVNIAYTMNLELKRPMRDGCLNPKERNAQQIMNSMVHGMLDEVKVNGETLYFSVPANAINTETDADYHSKVLSSIFGAFEDDKGFKVNANPINEALALVYAEMAPKGYTGVGISCLIPGTKIYTDRGILPIEEVRKGDKVITHKGRWKEIQDVIVNQYEGISTELQIQGYSNHTDEYKFVQNHELYVRRNNEWKWIGCEEVEVGDIVGEPILKHDRQSTIPAINLCERTTCSKTWTKKRIEASPDVQRLIGYFMGDGSVNKSEFVIQFDFENKEIENINDVKDILLKNFGKESSLVEKGENCTRIKCYSKAMCSWFDKHCYDKKRNKQYPWNLNRLNRSSCLNLLAGLVRSDGEITSDQIRFYNTNTNLVLLAKQLFSKLGMAASITWRKASIGGNVNGRDIVGQKPEWIVSSGAKLTMNSMADTIANLSCENSIFSERIFIEEGFCCGRIQKIEHNDYTGFVYDLKVEDDHSFSGPYLTIHNCGAGMVNLCFAIYGAPVFSFAIVNSGDWIDKQAAKATGESATFINREKTKVNLNESSDSLVHRAIKAQYEIMIAKTVTEIKRGLAESGNKARTGAPIDFVVAGGTSMPTGFTELFSKSLQEANLPIELGNVIRPADPLYSVARGCLIAAENAQ